LSDVITDAFEALEALAKIVCGNEKTLDASAEQFISKIKAADDYKSILKAYIPFAHKFRPTALIRPWVHQKVM